MEWKEKRVEEEKKKMTSSTKVCLFMLHFVWCWAKKEPKKRWQQPAHRPYTQSVKEFHKQQQIVLQGLMSQVIRKTIAILLLSVTHFQVPVHVCVSFASG